MKRRSPMHVLAVAALTLAPAAASAEAPAAQVCIFKDASGKIEQVNSQTAIPERYRKSAQCFDGKNAAEQRLAAPQAVTLEGSQRLEDMGTSLGRIHLRWERKAERLFGRTPVRAMSDAANTVSKAIKNAAFPTAVQDLSQEWQVVFLGDTVPAGQVPVNLITNCHPGWMTAPSNIYIVSDRVAGGCGEAHSSTSVADSTLTEVLLHEMGHAVEFQLLGKNDIGKDRLRAEGFATFFAMYAARYSSVVSQSTMEKREYALARQSVMDSPDGFTFGGTGYDYARAAMYFVAVEQKLGLRSVMQIYEAMNKKGLDFTAAYKDATGWDSRRRDKEIREILKIPDKH